ncbi:MAG: phytoene desaturase [Acidobacteria bacterium]|nr:phytoene desaturase [Acidobacteriota bacterium]
MREQTVVIIGGGLGGLGAAVRLAARGRRVIVCESGATFGGKMNTFEHSGFRFDTGPSLITMPWVFEDLFSAAGSRLADHLELAPMHPISEYVYPDGMRFDYSSSLPEWLSTLERFGRSEADGFLRFMELGARLFAVSRETFLRYRPRDWWRAGEIAGLRRMPLRFGWGNYHRTVEAHFRSPHLRQLYDRYPTYVGSSPYQSPATLAVIPYIEYAFGGWYPQGGLYRIVESLVELARVLKVELRAGARVASIDRAGERVCGVTLEDGEKIRADVVVMNGDAGDAPGLLGEAGAKSLAPNDRSMSGLVFLFGVGRTMPELRHHTIFFSEDYRREFDELFVERKFPSDPTVYVNAPSRTDRSVVPGEGEALFVMANAPANDGDEWDEAQIAEARSRVMATLARGGMKAFENDVVVADVWTPRRIGAKYLMPGGAIYGAHSHGWRKAFLRPPNKDRRVRGLYYVGGGTHPGGGAPTVLISAQITSELIERYEKS